MCDEFYLPYTTTSGEYIEMVEEDKKNMFETSVYIFCKVYNHDRDRGHEHSESWFTTSCGLLAKLHLSFAQLNLSMFYITIIIL